MIKKDECTGCSACFAICNHHAISMLPSNTGFLYPFIDNDKCVNCGLCDKVCEMSNSRPINNDYEIIALRHKDDYILKASTSGGAFRLFADYVLSLGGVIYGAAYNDDLSVHHIRCETSFDLLRLQKSKYVQSDTQDIYKQVEKDIKAGRIVLYSGTACQCSGVLAYVQKKNLNLNSLYTCDVICHGVPSPQIWLDYLTFRRTHQGEIDSVDFRCKKKSWRDFRMSISFRNGKTKTYRQNEDYFMILFFHDYILRKSCYNCKFCSVNRKTDFTIGDFWGLEEFYPEYDDDNGTSVVILNSDKSRRLFDKVKNSSHYFCINESELTLRQPNLRRSTHLSPRYDEFWMDYNKYGFEFCIRKYADYSFWGIIKRRYIFKFLFYTGIFQLLLKIKNK